MGEPDQPAIDIDRPKPRYPLIFIGGFVFICLACLMVLAASAGAWAMLALAIFSLAGAAAFAYFNSLDTDGGLQRKLDWQPVLPDVQKQGLALEVESIAASLDLDPLQTADTFMAFVVAEDLALRRLQQEHSAPMIRHLMVGATPFDALIIEPDELIPVEVCFVVKPDVRQEKIDSMLRKMGTVKRYLAAQRLDVALRLIIVVVTQLTPDEVEALKLRLTNKRFPDSPVNIDIHFFDFEELQRTYMTEG